MYKRQEIYILLGEKTQLSAVIHSGLESIFYKDETNQIENRFIMSTSNTPVQIGSLIKVRQRKNDVFINFDKKGYYLEYDSVDIEQINEKNYLIENVGRVSVMENEFGNIWVTIIFSLIGLYMILAFQFDSFLIPFVILSEIPLSFSGGIIFIGIAGYSLNLIVFVGMITLLGYIINDSILKIDSILIYLRKGEDINTSILLGGRRRFNSIIMTTITTILSIIPSLLFDSGGVQLQRPQYVIILGGVIFGVFVSLFFIPVFFRAIYKLDLKIKKWFS